MRQDVCVCVCVCECISVMSVCWRNLPVDEDQIRLVR
jgi:hypothetical protein